jgi:hypothetical protein
MCKQNYQTQSQKKRNKKKTILTQNKSRYTKTVKNTNEISFWAYKVEQQQSSMTAKTVD